MDGSRRVLRVGDAVLLIGVFVAVGGLLPAALNQALWSRLGTTAAAWLNLIATAAANSVFFFFLGRMVNVLPRVFHGITLANAMKSAGCALLFYALVDRMLDPLLHALFPASAESYERTLATLRQVPVTSFVNVCVMTPIVEETLIRGYVLGGLKSRYGAIAALAISTALFAILHFNFIQTLSALLCGCILGLLYIQTESLFCCIAAHSLYNAILFFTTVLGNH